MAYQSVAGVMNRNCKIDIRAVRDGTACALYFGLLIDLFPFPFLALEPYSRSFSHIQNTVNMKLPLDPN